MYAELIQKRKKINSIFKQMDNIKSQITSVDLFFNITYVTLVISYFLNVFNGQIVDCKESFIESCLRNCQMLQKGSQFTIKSATELFEYLENSLKKNGEAHFVKFYTIEDFKATFRSRFCVCEVLYILNELISESECNKELNSVKTKLLFYIEVVLKSEKSVLEEKTIVIRNIIESYEQEVMGKGQQE